MKRKAKRQLPAMGLAKANRLRAGGPTILRSKRDSSWQCALIATQPATDAPPIHDEFHREKTRDIATTCEGDGLSSVRQLTDQLVVSHHPPKPIVGEKRPSDGEAVLLRAAVTPSRQFRTFPVLQDVFAAAGAAS